MPATAKKKSPRGGVDEADAIWGCTAIGRVINRTTEQTRYLIHLGVLDGAVRKVGHRTYVGSRAKLRALTNLPAAS